MTTPKFDPRVRDLAEKIYCDLVSNAVEITQTSVGITTDPANLASISFKLAASFHAVEDKLNADNLPKNQDFKVGVDDIASWGSK
jgi:hypothetical protein